MLEVAYNGRLSSLEQKVLFLDPRESIELHLKGNLGSVGNGANEGAHSAHNFQRCHFTVGTLSKTIHFNTPSRERAEGRRGPPSLRRTLTKVLHYVWKLISSLGFIVSQLVYVLPCQRNRSIAYRNHGGKYESPGGYHWGNC